MHERQQSENEASIEFCITLALFFDANYSNISLTRASRVKIAVTEERL